MFNNAYLNRPIHPKPSKPRYTLRAPEREVAFRQENITKEKTRLFLMPRGNPQSQEAFIIIDEEDTSVFTATGQKYGGRSCRELRDASGLPLCDMHKKPLSSPFSWVVTLPGSKPTDAAAVIAKATPQWSWTSIDLHFTFRNSAAAETKSEEEKDVSFTVKKHGHVLAFFDILDADRRIAEVRESISNNEKLALRRNTRGVNRRPALDLIIAPGMDISLTGSLGEISLQHMCYPTPNCTLDRSHRINFMGLCITYYGIRVARSNMECDALDVDLSSKNIAHTRAFKWTFDASGKVCAHRFLGYLGIVYKYDSCGDRVMKV